MGDIKGKHMKRLSVILIILFVVLNASVVFSANIYIPDLKVKSGEIVNIPVMIDKVDNLAGAKLVIKYDAEMLAFKRAGKTKYTSSLMHIVNSKKPGLLIIVMAGATGIKGEKFPILSLVFEVKKNLKNRSATKIKITDIQLMSDKLKDIKCKPFEYSLIVSQ